MLISTQRDRIIHVLTKCRSESLCHDEQRVGDVVSPFLTRKMMSIALESLESLDRNRKS